MEFMVARGEREWVVSSERPQTPLSFRTEQADFFVPFTYCEESACGCEESLRLAPEGVAFQVPHALVHHVVTGINASAPERLEVERLSACGHFQIAEEVKARTIERHKPAAPGY